MAGCNKSYADNFVTDRLSTRVHAPPGGGSSVGSLLFGGGANDHQTASKSTKYSKKENKENVVPENKGNKRMDALAEHVAPKTLKKCDNDGAGKMSDAEKVREFTFEAGQPVPEKPQLMAVDEVNFIAKMILDELLELYSTVMGPKNAKAAMTKMLSDAKNVPKMNVHPNKTHELIAEQGDAFVDIWYYSLNCMAKKGVNLSSIFDLVHNANMAKRDPETGKFIKRADGKIIKPKGWRAPNVSAEIKRQQDQGAWNQ